MSDEYILYIAVDIPDDISRENELIEMYKDAIEDYNNKCNENKFMDSGFDLFIAIEHFMRKYTQCTINHFVRACCYLKNKSYIIDDSDEYIPSAYYLYPRSSISKTPLRMANSVGIIDSGYRGNIMAKVDVHVYNFPYDDKNSITEDKNKNKNFKEKSNNIDIKHNNDFYRVKKNMRLFQLCSPTLTPFKQVILVDKHDSIMSKYNTERGDGGFGSTNR